MFTFWCFITICAILQSTFAETSLEIEISEHLQLLEDRTYFPITLYLSGLATEFESLVTNFTNYRLDAEEVIHSYTQSITEDVDSIAENFEEIGIDVETCEENIHDNIKHIVRKSFEHITSVVLDGVSDGQRVISRARNTFMLVQNKTNEVRFLVHNCKLLLADSNCLLEALKTILVMERTLPKIISSVGAHHETRLFLLEDDVLSGLEKIVVAVFDDYVEILDDFIICTLQ